jgi:hypothetical protein
MHINSYLDELSQVFFGKKNMRNKRTWWLSTFYSFCIQNLVRKILMALDPSAFGSQTSRYREYLYDPIKLFIASSGVYDPLMESWENISNEEELTEGRNPSDLREAQLAVRQSDWEEMGIKSSTDYLKKAFEINSSHWSQLPSTPPFLCNSGPSNPSG